MLDVGDCPLPVIRNGSVISDTFGNGEATPHGEEIYYTCRDGFINNTQVPRCDNGTWTTEAVCNPGKAYYWFTSQRAKPYVKKEIYSAWYNWHFVTSVTSNQFIFERFAGILNKTGRQYSVLRSRYVLEH